MCGAYPIEAVLGSRGGWDFGFNVGGGIGFGLGDSGEFYIETRYHYVWGPEIVSATTLPSSAGSGGRTPTASTCRSRSAFGSEDGRAAA